MHMIAGAGHRWAPRRPMLAAITCLGIALSGCATTLPTLPSAYAVSPDRLLNFASPVEGGARVVILRDRNFVGTLVQYQVLIDGVVAVKIGAGEAAFLHISAGKHIIELRHPNPVLGMPGDAETVDAMAGSSHYFRINTDTSIKLLPTTRESLQEDEFLKNGGTFAPRPKRGGLRIG